MILPLAPLLYTTASARIYSVQPVRLPAAGRVSRPGTSTLVEVTSIGVRQGAPKWRLIVSGTRLRIEGPTLLGCRQSDGPHHQRHRATLLHGNHHIRLCGHAIPACRARGL